MQFSSCIAKELQKKVHERWTDNEPQDLLRKCKTYHLFVTSVYQFSKFLVLIWIFQRAIPVKLDFWPEKSDQFH